MTYYCPYCFKAYEPKKHSNCYDEIITNNPLFDLLHNDDYEEIMKQDSINETEALIMFRHLEDEKYNIKKEYIERVNNFVLYLATKINIPRLTEITEEQVSDFIDNMYEDPFYFQLMEYLIENGLKYDAFYMQSINGIIKDKTDSELKKQSLDLLSNWIIEEEESELRTRILNLISDWMIKYS